MQKINYVFFNFVQTLVILIALYSQIVDALKDINIRSLLNVVLEADIRHFMEFSTLKELSDSKRLSKTSRKK